MCYLMVCGLAIAVAMNAGASSSTQPTEESSGDSAPRSLTREETEQLLSSMEEDIGVMRLAWSAIICRWTMIRTDAKREIEKEKRYARTGAGVVSLRALYGEQQRIRLADERIQRARDSLRDLGAKPLACKNKDALAAVICIAADWEGVVDDDDSLRICRARDMVLLVEVAYRADGYLRR